MEFPKDRELFLDLKREGSYELDKQICPPEDSLKDAMRNASAREGKRFYADVSSREPWLYEREFLEWVRTHDRIGDFPGWLAPAYYRGEELSKEEYEWELAKWKLHFEIDMEERAAEARRAAERRQELAVQRAEARAWAAFDAEEEARLEALDQKVDLAERVLHNSYYTNQERVMRGEMSEWDYGMESTIRDDLADKIRQEMDEKRQAAAEEARASIEEARMYENSSETISGSLKSYIFRRHGVKYLQVGKDRYVRMLNDCPCCNEFEVSRVLKLAPDLKELAQARRKQQQLQRNKDNKKELHQKTISGAISNDREPWIVTLFLLLLSGAVLYLLAKIGLTEWLPLYLKDPELAVWYAVPKVSLLFFHVQAHTALVILIALVLFCLMGTNLLACRGSIKYSMAIMMGILLGASFCLSMATWITVIVIIGCLFFESVIQEEKSFGMGVFSIFLVVAAAIGFLCKRDFFIEDSLRLENLAHIFLTATAALAVYTGIMILVVTRRSRQRAEKVWTEYEQKLEKDLTGLNEKVPVLEQKVSALTRAETEDTILFEYKVIRLMELWLRALGRLSSETERKLYSERKFKHDDFWHYEPSEWYDVNHDGADLFADMEAELRRAVGAPAVKRG